MLTPTLGILRSLRLGRNDADSYCGRTGASAQITRPRAMPRESRVPVWIGADDVDVDEWAALRGIRPAVPRAFIRARCWDAIERIPFGSIGSVDVDDRVVHLVRRAALALERFVKELPTSASERFDVRFAAELPNRSDENPWRSFSITGRVEDGEVDPLLIDHAPTPSR